MKVRTYDIAVTNRPHRTHPKTLFDAQMSIPFCLAVVAYRGAAGEAAFTEDVISDRALQSFAQKVVVEADPHMSRAFPREWPAETQVKLKDGRQFVRHVAHPKGEPEAPMSGSEIENKFRELADVAITPSAADRVIAAVWALDRHKDIGQVLDAIAGGLHKRRQT